MLIYEANALMQIVQPPLGQRTEKPRTKGLTMVIDKGLGLNELEDLLETSGNYIDILKFGFGTAPLYSEDLLKRKLSLARLHHVNACTGGTLGEIAFWQGKFDEYVDTCLALGFTAIEISDGTLPLDAHTRYRLIETVSKKTTVLSEVGKKIEEFPSPDIVVGQILSDLDAGADLVVIEARESGENIGIYGAKGEVSEDILNRLTERLSAEVLSRVMWEAPKKSQQIDLLKRFGQTVNLGNIPPSEAMALECLRLGLRGDTLSWVAPAPSSASPKSTSPES